MIVLVPFVVLIAAGVIPNVVLGWLLALTAGVVSGYALAGIFWSLAGALKR